MADGGDDVSAWSMMGAPEDVNARVRDIDELARCSLPFTVTIPFVADVESDVDG